MIAERVRLALVWLGLGLALVALILIPFALWGSFFDQFVKDLFIENGSRSAIFLMGAMLLASDVFLPIPSSLVSMALGIYLGPAIGTLSSVLGMTLGVCLGWLFGRLVGSAALSRLVDERHRKFFEAALKLRAVSILIGARPIPVLAEASIICAGAAKIPLISVLWPCTVANFLISLAYAGIGGILNEEGGFFVALATCLVISAISWQAQKWFLNA